MTMSIAKQLVRGSRAIDQMRKDFNDVITLLVGYLGANLVKPLEEDGFSISHELVFNKDIERWKVGRYAGKAGILYFEFEISPWDGYRTVYHSDNLPTPSARDIQRLWESLPILIEGLAEQYPQLRVEWKPLLKASIVFEPK